MSYGMTTTGFITPRLEDLLAKVRADLADSEHFGANVNSEPESGLGHLIEIFCGALAEAWESTERVWMAQRLWTASGTQLDEVAALRGVSGRRAATSSTVTMTLSGTPATVIPAGSEVRLAGSLTVWALLADATIGGGGTVNATFACLETGPKIAEATSEWTILTPVAGWTLATNAADATLGREVETDADLRLRLLDLAFATTGSPDGLVAALRLTDGVTHARAIENASPVADGEGRPAHSVEVVVQGGDDDVVAAAIWANSPVGIAKVSTVPVPTVVVIVDANGDNQSVTFSRPQLKNVWLEVDYARKATFPSDGADRIEAAVLEFGAALIPGLAVDPVEVEQAILCALPSRSVSQLTLRMGLSSGPVTAVQVPASQTQLASFAPARITITDVT